MSVVGLKRDAKLRETGQAVRRLSQTSEGGGNTDSAGSRGRKDSGERD